MGDAHSLAIRWTLLSALLSLALVGLLSRAAASTPYRFAPEAQYGPFIFENANGQLQGLSIDVLAEILNHSGLQIAVLPAAPLSAQLQALREGRADFISSLRVTPERLQYLGFSRPYVSVPAVLVLPLGDTRRNLAEFRGARVAVGAGYGVEAFVRAAHPEVDWVPKPDDLVALRALADGSVSAVIADVASITFLRQQHELPEFQMRSGLGFEYALSFNCVRVWALSTP